MQDEESRVDAFALDGSTTPPCSRCTSTERPDASGLCPTPNCRCFRRGNSAARVHGGRATFGPDDVVARDKLVTRLVAERGGNDALDVVTRLSLNDYATAVVQLLKVTQVLESHGAVSSQTARARSSVVAAWKLFSERVQRLGAELPPPVAALSPEPTSVAVIRRVVIDTPHEPSCAPSPEPVAASPAPTSTFMAPSAAPRSVPATVTTDTPSRDAQLRAADLHTWRLIHARDPDEVHRRKEEVTAELIEGILNPGVRHE